MAKRSNFSKKGDTRVSKKRRIKYKKIIIFFVILLLIVLSIYLFFQLRITNIYISNNYYLSDQDIIEIAEISDYPAIYKANFVSIKNKLKRNQLIKNAKVTQKMFTSIYIDVTENRPIFVALNRTNQPINNRKQIRSRILFLWTKQKNWTRPTCRSSGRFRRMPD